jgi:large subunit ribosomal protein L9
VSAAGSFGDFEMEVILKEDVTNLGFRGEVVKVADGYARNYLLPRKLAMQATDTNKAVIEQMKTSAARRSAGEKVKAEEFGAKLDAVTLTFTRKVGEAGHLFGSVTSADIATELAAQGIEVDRRKIQLGEPFKSIGEFTVAVRLHREVTAHIKIKVQGDKPEEKKEPEHEKPTEPAKPEEPKRDDVTIGPPAEQTQFD